MHRTNSPDGSDASIEHQIVAKGKTAARVRPTDLDDAIREIQFHVFTGSQLTVCVLTLQNGFTVTGESACASPENFDVDIGRNIAFDNAKQKIWPLLGYVLKQKLHERGPAPARMAEFERFEGTKRLAAMPMTLGAYNQYRGWAIPANEDPNKPGYIVEYEDGGDANDARHVGYISWSPKDVFERSYQRI